MAVPNKETLLDWYRQMVLIREFEETCHQLYWDKHITGVYLHLYSGSEAIGVGGVATLEERDHVITSYRDHGIAIARGLDLGPLMAEMMGKTNGISGGKGGSMHLASRDHHFWGGYAIVAGHLPLAAGIALESRYNDKDAVVLCLFGDGASNNGYFHESLNMSAIWDLPVVWLVENNGYGMGTEVDRVSGQPEIHKKAAAYCIHDLGRVDGQDVLAVNKIVSEAVEYARDHGPVMLEAITYRYRGHGVSDRQYNTRLEDELEEWRENKDPITIFRKHLMTKYKNIESDLDAFHEQAKQQVQTAVKFGEDGQIPGADELFSNVYV